MCSEKKDCCCENETNKKLEECCDKSIPHKEKGTKTEYPCGQKRKGADTCCCEETDK